MNISKINWFPGHMKKSLANFSEISKHLDLVIEVVDARCPNLSSNSELLKIFNNKPILKVALKKDLADTTNSQIDNAICLGNSKDKHFRKLLFSYINKALSEKKSRYLKKGLLKPQFKLLVIGLPNVGKSSLINLLLGKNKIVSENRPGVTKTNHLVKLSDEYYIYDSPGIFFKNISNLEDGIKLALIKVVNPDILNLHEVIEWAFHFYQKNNYSTHLSKQLNIDNVAELDFHTFLETVASKYGFLTAEGRYDETRTLNFLFNKITGDNWFGVNYEK